MFGKNLIKIDKVDSTNKYAQDLVEKGEVPEGTVVIAREQTRGRGMDQNLWESEAGKNLTFSLFIYPTFLSAESQFYLNKVFSLGLLDFLKDLGIDKLHIKWPNDVYINEGKAAGILIQNAVQGISFNYSIVGIGLNLNQQEFHSEAPNPVSVRMITGKDYDTAESLVKVLYFLEKRYSQLADGNYKLIDQDYIDRLWKYGTIARYKFQGEVINARIIGVDKYGHLLLEEPSSRIIECAFKEVEFLPA